MGDYMNCQNCAKIFCSNRDKIDNCLDRITFLQANCKEIKKYEDDLYRKVKKNGK